MPAASPTSPFRLLHAPLAPEGVPGELPVPETGGWLHRPAPDRPVIAAHRPEGSEEAAIFLEPIARHRPPGLLAVCAAGNEGLRVNGGWTPSFLVLHERDELLAPSILETPFFITRFVQPSIGPAPAGAEGGTCPICRTEIAAGARAYRCPCGAVLHAEIGDGHDALNCVEFADSCPSCGTPLLEAEGYTWLPEDLA